jgi:hypothetical protein
MSNSVVYDSSSGLICVTLVGAIDKRIMDDLTMQTLSLVQQHSCFRVLADLRRASSAVSTIDLFQRARETAQHVSATNIPSSYKRALVVGDNVEDPRFFETVSQNREQQVRIFQDIKDAKRWLME